MAHFTYTRVGGVWATLTDLLSAEVADLDSKTFRSINGDDGGTWAPGSVIIIGGQGIQVDGPLHATGEFKAIGGSLTLGDSSGDVLTVGATTIFENGVTFTSPTSPTVFAGIKPIFDNGLTASGSVSLLSTLSVTGNATFLGRLDVSGSMKLGDSIADVITSFGAFIAASDAAFATNVTLGSDATNNIVLQGTTTAQQPINLVNKGHINERVYVVASDSDLTLGVEDADVIYYPNGVLTADRNLRIKDLGATSGSKIVVISDEPTLKVTIRRDADSFSLNEVRSSSGKNGSAAVRFMAGTWRRGEFSVYP